MNRFIIWLDDIRPNPYGVKWSRTVRSVRTAKQLTLWAINAGFTSITFDLDHDLGDYAEYDGDGIDFVNWLVENFHNTNLDFIFHFHSMNSVGVQNMRNAIKKYWKEI